MQTLEQRLCAAKDKLDMPDLWRRKLTMPSEKQIRDTIKSLKGIRGVSRAWLKFTEILHLTPLGRHLARRPIRAFFNAELPGAFVYATIHYAKERRLPLQWVIASYLPKDKSKSHLDDSFGLIKTFPDRSLVGWRRGEWVDGDLTSPDMPKKLAAMAKAKLGEITLYTADGGFDVQGQENMQETLSLPLIRGEVETGLACLAKGGCMVLKIFTFFTEEMRSILAKLMASFEYMDLYKPQTSGMLNSECYVVCIGYKGETVAPVDTGYIQRRLEELVEAQIAHIEAFLRDPKSMPEIDLSWLDS